MTHPLFYLHFYDYLVFAFLAWNDGARDRLTINGYLLDALLLAFWVLYHDVVFATTELAGYLVFMGGAWETWVDVQTLVIWLDAEDELADRIPHPCCCTGEPGVLSFARFGCILTGYHLAVYVRFYLVQSLILLFYIAWQNLGIMVPGIVATTGYGFTDDNPRIVVAEDAGILLVTFRIG